MKLLALIGCALATVVLAGAASAAKGGNNRPVEVYVVVPANAQTPITSQQADAAVRSWLGSPSDAPCTGNQNCSIEGWFRAELGQVFDYTVEVMPMRNITAGVDECGSFRGAFLYQYLEQTSIGLSTGARSMVLMLGAGGWAGHFSPADRKVPHFGMVGDWGVMEEYGVEVPCIPEWDYPMRGFSHEFMGMMGAYVTAGYNEGGLFIGDAMSANIKRDLLKYSGRWLREP